MNQLAMDLLPDDERGWIGFTDTGGEGNWYWVDGTVNNYTTWRPNAPNAPNSGIEQCAFIIPGTIAKWDDAVCDVYPNFHCFLCNFE